MGRSSLYGCVHHVVVGCHDLERSLALYTEHLGLVTHADSIPLSHERAALWGLGDTNGIRQALVGSKDEERALVRLLDFGHQSKPPVREGAQPFDRSPKNLDYVVPSVEDEYLRLHALGYTFRSEPVSWEYDGHTIYETQLPTPEQYNIVLTSPLPDDTVTTLEGYSTVVLVVTDVERSVQFYSAAFGMPVVHHARFAGPAIETMVGLGEGRAIRMRVIGPTRRLGQIELVQYEGAEGRNLYPWARPPHVGLLYPALAVPEVEETAKRLTDFGAPVITGPLRVQDNVLGSVTTLLTRDPDGSLLEVFSCA